MRPPGWPILAILLHARVGLPLASLFSFSSMRQALPPWRVRRRSGRSSDSDPVGKIRLLPERTSLWSASPRVEVHVLDRQIPVGIENFESPLFFLLVRFLIRIESLDQRGAVEIVVGNRGALEDDGHPVIPAAVFGHVIARRGHAYLQHAAQLDLLFQNWIVVFLEERQEFFGVTPFRLVVVLHHIWLLFRCGRHPA